MPDQIFKSECPFNRLYFHNIIGKIRVIIAPILLIILFFNKKNLIIFQNGVPKLKGLQQVLMKISGNGSIEIVFFCLKKA